MSFNLFFAFGWFFRDLKWLFLTIGQVCLLQRGFWTFHSATAIYLPTLLKFWMSISLPGRANWLFTLLEIIFNVQSFFLSTDHLLKRKKSILITLLLSHYIWPHKGEFFYVYTVFSFHLTLFAFLLRSVNTSFSHLLFPFIFFPFLKRLMIS